MSEKILKTKAAFFLMLVFFVSLNLSAQEDSLAKARVNIKAFTLEQSEAVLACFKHLDKLVGNARVKNEIEEYRFIELFENEEAPIVNEILSANAMNDPVSLSGYLDASLNYYQGGTMNTYQLRPYRIIITSSNATKFVIEIDAIKEIGLLSNYNIFFRDDFDLKYEMSFDRASQEVKIRSIKLNREKGYFLRLDFPENLKGKDDVDILVNGELVKRNLDNGIMLRDLKDGEKLVIEPESDELLGGFNKVIKKELAEPEALYDGEIQQLKFRPKRFYIDLGFTTASSDIARQSITMDGTEDEVEISHKQRETAFTMGLGYRLINSKDKFFVSLEVMGQQRTIQLGSRMNPEDLMLSSYQDTDPQFGSIERFTRSSFIEESSDISVTSLGAGLNFRFKLHKMLHLAFAGAYNIGLTQSGTYSSTSVNDYYLVWNQANLEFYGDNSEFGIGVNNSKNSEGNLSIQSYSNINLRGNLSFRLTKQFWVEAGVNYGLHNWGYDLADEILFSKNLTDQPENVESLKHLSGTLPQLSTLGYQLGIKYFF